MTRRGLRTPFLGPQLFRTMAAEYSRDFFRVDASLLAKYAPYFFLPRAMYLVGLRKRHAAVPEHFIDTRIRVWRGRLWRGLFVQEIHIGCKAGALARTRVLAVFRQKASRKKKPTTASAAATLLSETRISRIRQKKAGFKKRAIGENFSLFDQQLSAAG